MWLSKNIGKNLHYDKAENSTVTLSDNNNIEATGTVPVRNFNSYSPFGYSCCTPIGKDVLILPSSDGQVCVGTKMKYDNLQTGEIKIQSSGGATILLKNDGSILLNGLKINSDGVIENG